MNEKTKIGLTWLLISILVIGLFIWSPWEDKTQKKVRYFATNEAINQRIYWDGSSGDIQIYIDALTGKDGWKFTNEKFNWSDTKNIEFPFIINRERYFKNPNNTQESYMQEQLFLFDLNRGIWLPLAVQGYEISGKEIKNSTKENLWYPENDWKESFSE